MGQHKIVICLLQRIIHYQIYSYFNAMNMNNIILLKMIPKKLTFSSLQKEKKSLLKFKLINHVAKLSCPGTYILNETLISYSLSLKI